MSTTMTEPFGSSVGFRGRISMAEDRAVSAPPTKFRPVASSPPAHGSPVPTAGSGFPRPGRPAALLSRSPRPGARAESSASSSPWSFSPRSATAGKWPTITSSKGASWYRPTTPMSEPRPTIVAAKAMGHLTQVPVVDNQVVHRGDLLALHRRRRLSQRRRIPRRRASTRRTPPSPASAGRSRRRRR